jgi:hypothetical protein
MGNATVDAARRKVIELYVPRIEATLNAKREAIRKNPVEGFRPLWDPWSELALAYYRPRQWKGVEAHARESLALAGNRVD